MKGQAIADWTKPVFTAYPNMRLELISRGDIGGGLIATSNDVTRRSAYGRHPTYRSHDRLSFG
jgi:hypothetical protein